MEHLYRDEVDPREVKARPDLRVSGPEVFQEMGRSERQGRLRELAFEDDPRNPSEIREYLQQELTRPREKLGGRSVLDKMDDGTFSEADPAQALRLPKKGEAKPDGGVWEDDYVLSHPEHTYDEEGNIQEAGQTARDGFGYMYAWPEPATKNRLDENERRANEKKRRNRGE